jgi:uncharacterized protein (TIGR03437 family)
LRVNLGTPQADAEVAVAEAAPSVFTVNQSGAGQGVVVHAANPEVLADSLNPVPRGAAVVIYCEGLGAVEPAIPAGQQTPNAPLRRAVLPVQVTIGGQPAEVLFAGLTPGLAGLHQINAVVPAATLPGSAVPLVVRVAGQSSAVVTIAVQ